MKTIFKNILLYFSAFIPMYFILLIQLIIEIINDNLHFNVLNTINLILLISLLIMGSIGLILALKQKDTQTNEIQILSVTNITDDHFFGYMSIFILFTLSFDLSNMSMFITTIIILAIIGIVYIHNKLFYINPLLNILGYSFYEITYKKKDSLQIENTKVFYKGNHNLKNKWVKVCLKDENLIFIDTKKYK